MDNKFDGDKMTGMGVYSNEGVAECKQVLASRNFYVLPDGNIAHSMNTDTVKFLMVGMTGSVPIVPAKEAQEPQVTELDYALMDRISTRQDLVNALASYIDATDYNLAPKLKELAELMRTLSDVPKQIKVYRGFSHAAGQNVMGAHDEIQLGEILSYRASEALVSTSISKKVAEGYGDYVIEIDLDADSQNFLVITPELYQLCANKRPTTAEKYKEEEVLIIPPNAFQGHVLRVAKESLGITFPSQPALQTSNERVNLDVETLFRDGSGRRPIVQINDVPYDLSGVMYSIEQGNIPSQSVNIKDELNWILDNPKFQVPFDQRCQGVKRDAPVIGVRFEEYDNDLVVIDGWPEVMRAIEAGKPNIDMYIVDVDQINGKSLGEQIGL